MTVDEAAVRNGPAGGQPANRSGLTRAMGVVRYIAQCSPQMLGVSTIARELDLPKAVAHRILKEFTAMDFLAFEDSTKRYRLGSGALSIGLAAMRSLDVPRIAHPYLEQLVAEASETATLSFRSGWHRIYVDQVLSPHEIRMSVLLGTTHPLYAGSSSKAILAFLDAQELDQYLAAHELEALTESTITDPLRLRAELAEIRAQGYATSLGERRRGAGSAAAPVFRSDGEVFGSLSLCGPLDRFGAHGLQRHGVLVAQAAREISRESGFDPARGTTTAESLT